MSSNLETLKRIKNKICFLHYSSSDMKKHPVKISAITLSEYGHDEAITYSRASKTEEEILSAFFKYIEDNPDKIYVGWNLKNISYGTQVLERRYKELLGKEPPIIKNVFDLDGIIEERYGKKYIGHEPQGKLYNLLSLNNVSCIYFLQGKTEAELYEKNDFREIEMSNSCKVLGIKKILELIFDNKLKTNASLLWKINYKIDNSQFLKFLGFFFAVAGFFISFFGLILTLYAMYK